MQKREVQEKEVRIPLNMGHWNTVKKVGADVIYDRNSDNLPINFSSNIGFFYGEDVYVTNNGIIRAKPKLNYVTSEVPGFTSLNFPLAIALYQNWYIYVPNYSTPRCFRISNSTWFPWVSWESYTVEGDEPEPRDLPYYEETSDVSVSYEADYTTIQVFPM
jgi:hypothetical protein